MNAIWIILMAVASAIVFMGTLWWLRRSILEALAQQKQDTPLLMLQHQVETLEKEVHESMESARRSMDERLNAATGVINQISGQLGQLQEAAQKIHEVGIHAASLKDILQAPKLRGIMGEFYLEELLKQVLPPDSYTLQHRFNDGTIVDAAIRLNDRLVPVDSKFPLEPFRAMLNAVSDTERETARKEFKRNVKGHIDVIRKKYIKPAERTFDFALMYIPSEGVYYEAFVHEETENYEESLFAYAQDQRVIPVSPYNFYAFLQTILLGLKGLQIEKTADEVLAVLSTLRKGLEEFSEAFRLVGQHLDNARKKFGEADNKFARIQARVEDIEKLPSGSGITKG